MPRGEAGRLVRRERARYRGQTARMLHRLRPAESDDFDWMLALPRGRDEDRRPPAERRARFTRAFARQPWSVVEVDRKPVGALSVGWDDEPAVLHTVALSAPWQGRGLGTRLVHDVLLEARARGQAVVVELGAGDPAAPLFRRLGFWPEEGAGVGVGVGDRGAGDGRGEGAGAVERVRLRWQASARTDETLRAAMSPWEDPQRRRAWARRLFEPAPDDAVGFVRFALGRYGVPSDARALVMGCGPGVLLRPLTALGLHVTGYEPDGDCQAVAARRAAAIDQTTQVRAGGLLDLDEAGAYDLAIAFDGVLWSLESHAHRVDALRRLRRALRPGGVLLIEGPNVPWLLQANRELPVRSELYHRATVVCLPVEDHDFHAGVVVRRDTIVVGVEEQEVAEWRETTRVAMLGLPFLRVAIEQGGFEGVETFGELGASGVGRCGGETVVVAARAP
jgi:SAM-dependent methyltransferase/GNAT superfamily N-acetyltransferase